MDLFQAWELWREGRGLELVDPVLDDSYERNEVLRCIHFGLLCVQENPNDRPTILDVVPMISSEGAMLSTPKQPAFLIGRSLQNSNIPKGESQNCALNHVSISEMETR